MAVNSALPTKDAFIDQWYPDQNFGNIIALFVGQFTQSGDAYRSLLHFDFGSLPPVSTINSARLNLYMYRNETSAAGTYLSVHRLLNTWSQENVTWNSQPPFNPSPFSPIWDGAIFINNATPLGLISIDITDLVIGWFTGSIVNNGLILVGDELHNNLVGFYSTNHPFSTMWPKLTVNYAEGRINVFDNERLTIPTSPASIGSTAIPLGSKESATFMVWNSSSSASVDAKVQVGFDDDPGALFFDVGEWQSLAPVGTDGEARVFSTTAAAEYSRVMLRGAGGETVWIYPRTKD